MVIKHRKFALIKVVHPGGFKLVNQREFDEGYFERYVEGGKPKKAAVAEPEAPAEPDAPADEEEAPASASDLMKLKRDDLIEVAVNSGIDIPEDATKKSIVELLLGG